MDGYRSLKAWQHASTLCLGTLEAIDDAWTFRHKAVFDQLARAVISADVNIVEGYALGTQPLYKRHLRIALGSSAEAERLLEIARHRGYLTNDVVDRLLHSADQAIRTLSGLMRSKHLRPRGLA